MNNDYNYYLYIMNPSSKLQDKPTYKLCENTDCERYPDDDDFDKENEEATKGIEFIK